MTPDPTVEILEKWRTVCRDRPRTVRELKYAIRDEISNINREMLRRMFDSFVDRLRQCIAKAALKLLLILIYLLTAIGLTPGGSSTVHIYT